MKHHRFLSPALLLLLIASPATAQQESPKVTSEKFPFPTRLISVLDGFHGTTLQAAAPTAAAGQQYFVIDLKFKRPDKPTENPFEKAMSFQIPNGRYIDNPIEEVRVGDTPIDLAGSKTPNVEAIATTTATNSPNLGWLITDDTTISLAYAVPQNAKEFKIRVVQDGKSIIYTVTPSQ